MSQWRWVQRPSAQQRALGCCVAGVVRLMTLHTLRGHGRKPVAHRHPCGFE